MGTGKSKKNSEKKDKSKKSKEKKDKKEKKGKTDKKFQKDDLIIPPIPTCNLRQKLGPENYEKMLDLLKDFERLEDMLEDQQILTQRNFEEENFFDDKNFYYKPSALIFKNFYRGKIYKKKLRLVNTSMQFQKLRLLKTVFSDPYDAIFFKVEPLFGIQKLAPRCFLQLTVIFTPEMDCQQIDGKIIFVTYNRHSTRYQKFFIKVQCIPSSAELTVHPHVVDFGKIPIWRMQTSSPKTIKINNTGAKSCTAVIKKVPDPVELLVNDNEINTNTSTMIDFAVNILQECLENVFSNFGFDHYYLRIQGLSEVKLNVRFKNGDYVGNYFEKYDIDVFEMCENVKECTGCQQICVSAETTDYVIEIPENCIDFGVCVINNVYQLSCDVINNSTVTQTISLKFPSCLVDYIKTNDAMLCISPLGKRTVWFKFIPRKSTLDVPMYYDRETSILEFPIHFCVLSKVYPDIPPLKVTVFAILTQQKYLTIVPPKTSIDETPTTMTTLYLGECSTFETVCADIQLVNKTLSPQIYGFTNVPQCVTITPCHGFGQIKANSKATLRLHFSPDFIDVMDGFNMEGNQLENEIEFKINLETISFLGQVKPEFNVNKFKKIADLMLKNIKHQPNKDLIRDIEICAYYTKINLFTPDTAEEGDSLYDRYNSVTTVQKSTSKIEFSHQYVRFPDTPCGSYSTIQVDLRSVNSEYFFKKSKSKFNYTAEFRIFGDSEQMTIEPTYGTLKMGDAKKITLVVRPNPPLELVTDIAKQFKYSEVYERKKQEYEMRKQELLAKGQRKGKKDQKKDKKGNKKSKKTEGKSEKADKKSKGDKTSKEKKGDKKSKKGEGKSEKEDKKPKGKNKEQEGAVEEEKEPEIIVTDKELTLDYLDFYPAEMYHWRNLIPYPITREFACVVDYQGEIEKKSDTLYLKAACTVIRPDFITNLKLQRIDFGQVLIGVTKSEPVVIQNIRHDCIEPDFSLLNPLGPFKLPYMKNVQIPPEHFLEVPMMFEPTNEGKVEEYFEIRSGATILSLILQGTGVVPLIEIFPKFLVHRLGTKKTAIAQCPIEIRNKNECELSITIEKVFEINGFIKEVIKTEETKKEKPTGKETKGKAKEKPKGKGKASKVDKQSKKTKESSKNKKDEIPKYSDELLDVEAASFEDFTKSDESERYYDLINIEGNKIEVNPKSTRMITIGFGVPEILAAKKQEELKKLQEMMDKAKGKGKKGDKKAKGSKGSKKSSPSKGSKKDVVKKQPETQLFHVAKYNIMMNKTFLKDLVLISTIDG